MKIKQPYFIHEFGDKNNHTYKGSLRRHFAVEKSLYAYQRLLNWIGDACPFYELLCIPLHIGFGLNCSFPLRDIVLYIWWSLRIWWRYKV